MVGNNDMYLEDIVFIRQRREAMSERVRLSVMRDVVEPNGVIRPKVDIEQVWDTRLSWAEYFRLRAELQRIMGEYPIDIGETITGISLENFVRSNKKGCRRYRNIISGRNSNDYKNIEVRRIRPLVTLWGEHIHNMSRQLIRSHLSTWKIGALESDFKDFLFRLVHGKLYLNNQRARFGNENRWCTFCGIIKEKGLRRRGLARGDVEYERELEQLDVESVEHLFWSCNNVNGIIKAFFGNMLQMQDVNINQAKFFEGWEEYSHDSTRWAFIVIGMVKYYLYKCSRRRVIPMLYRLKEEFGWLCSSLMNKRRWREIITNNNRIMSEIIV
jgi:hypothetical protein